MFSVKVQVEGGEEGTTGSQFFEGLEVCHNGLL